MSVWIEKVDKDYYQCNSCGVEGNLTKVRFGLIPESTSSFRMCDNCLQQIPTKGDKMQIILSKQIHSGFSTMQTGDVWLIKKIENFPMPPFVGMLIHDEFISQIAVNINNEIICYCKEDTTFYHRGSSENYLGGYSDTPEFAELIEGYKSEGWQ